MCELAVASLADPHSFDDGYWPSALERARAVVPGPVPQVEVPDIEPHDVSPVAADGQIMSRVAPRRSGVVVPVVDAIAKVERSRPGWRLSGLPEQVALPAASTHLGVFAIDEGDNEVLAIVPVGAVAAVVDLTEDNVITGLHERAWLMDRLAVAALVDVLRSLEAPAGEAEGFSRARAHAAVQAAVVSLDQQQLTVRATAVSAAVTYVASLVGDDLRLDRDWHLTRLVTLL
ncbi:hypothetical protein [Aeromicrobium sp. UC242_57]|uniref:hypothetical protein n=1 Tax=Aeromicrobium sp. UC242_57 TaxID=3374624 RepID=UPI0037963013